MFNEADHPRGQPDNKGQFREKESAEQKLARAERIYNSDPPSTLQEAVKKKITPAEKIASVHIDFDKDNILPELNDEDLVGIGVEKNKSVLLKKNIIDRNAFRHNELTEQDGIKIISEALYSDKKEIIPSKYSNKPNYYTFAKIVRLSNKDGSPMSGVVLLDVDGSKENFEIVHWHYVPYDELESLGPKKQ